MPENEPSSNVGIDPAALRWVGSRYGGCFLTFDPASDVDAKALVREIRVAVATMERSVGEQPVRVASVVENVEAVHVYIRYLDATRAQIRAWTQGLSRALGAAGLTGQLRRPLPQYAEQWVTLDGLYRHGITTRYYSRGLIDAGFVARLVKLHKVDRHEHHVLSQTGDVSLRVRDVAAAVAAIAEPMDMGHLTGWTNDPPSSGEVSAGDRTAAGWTPVGDLIEQVGVSRAALSALAPDVDYACAYVGVGFNRYVKRVAPGGVTSSRYAQRRTHWPSRVPDAYGLQVLTTEHLDRASDLTDWHTREVGGGRYLVAARDPAGWFRSDGPDPHTRDRARADFGNMIATQAEYDAEQARMLEELDHSLADDTPSEAGG